MDRHTDGMDEVTATVSEKLNYLTSKSKSPTLVVIGDSFSWGAGLVEYSNSMYPKNVSELHQDSFSSWPENMKYNYGGVISRIYGMNYVNMSVPGCSNDTILRMIHKVVETNQFNPSDTFFIIGWTASHRYEVHDASVNDTFLNMSPYWEPSKKSPHWIKTYHQLYNQRIFSVDESENRSVRTIASGLSYLNSHKYDFFSLFGVCEFSERSNLRHRLSFINGNHMFDISRFSDQYKNMLLPCLHPDKDLHVIIAEKILTIA